MPKKENNNNWELILCNSTQDIQITFEVTEIEYDRAEGAQISIHVKHPYLQTTLHGFWWRRSSIAAFIEKWEEREDNAILKTDDLLIKIIQSDYESNLAIGFRATHSFAKKLKSFPLEIALSFEVSKITLEQFFADLKVLESNCRPY